tara:strand:+ start:221 stop:631 length:411 start_codon:yes stop_codon:yes gene_type:complete
MSITVHVHDGIDDLANDLVGIAKRSRGDMRDTVSDGIKAGAEVAKGYARTNNPPGSHARKYPGTISSRMNAGAGLFGNTYSGEYGPYPRGQGFLGLILENGTRNGNRPQMNMARSVDIVGPAFASEVRGLPDKWFW